MAVKIKQLENDLLIEKKQRAMQMRVPYDFNRYQNSDIKQGAMAPFSYLRRLSISYPIARACINRRVRQITSLDWDIAPVDDLKADSYATEIKLIKEFFKSPAGHNTKFRRFVSTLIEDLLVIDAIALEKQKTYKGDLLYLLPVDPSTIVLRVTKQGGTPIPPEPAYAQYINGEEVAVFTTNEMMYESLNARSYNPYGLAPLESLLIQVQSALYGSLYNFSYFKEGNVPEGFITLPEDVASSPEQVREWQEHFDALLAGDVRYQRRLKILPEGSEYTPAKKPEDMSFEKFEMWLLQQTCAVFDVQPQDIGITYQVNKATAEEQTDIGKSRGLYPLTNFLKELFDEIIQKELGYTELEFVWNNLNPVDRKEEVEIADKEIRIGALSVDEYRQEKGLDPIGLGHFVMTASGPILLKDVLNPPKPEESKDTPQEEPKDNEEIKEMRQWRKCVYNDLDANRSIRKFDAKHIDADTYEEVSKALVNVHSKAQARLLFDTYLNPELKASIKLLELAGKLRSIQNAELI